METPSPAPDRTARSIRLFALAMLLSMLAAAALFMLWPELDLRVSTRFYCPENRYFTGENQALVMWAYRFVPDLSKCVIVLVVAAFAISFFIRGPRGRDWRIRAGFLVAALALGQGLIIDVALKDHIGRARPENVVQFGGNARFTPAFAPSNQCEQNCSFVSGHASAGFFFTSFAFLGGAAAWRRWTVLGLVLGGLTGLGRISQGGHFLSDVVFAFYVTWFSAWLVWLIFRRLGWLSDKSRTA
ncbi:MAG: phosphatase PAP2 family protein [Azoarcus sp.]|jgi:lipid A 4'-phosphatase|nr:phosphatase PAP2 family protein [Azoarcus sp.]